jgi:hypothetical protein
MTSGRSIVGSAGRTHAGPPDVDNAPPTRTKVTGALAALACAACCALPLLIAAGVLTGAGAAIAQQTLLAVAAGLTAAALGDVVAAPAAQRPTRRGGGHCRSWLR